MDEPDTTPRVPKIAVDPPESVSIAARAKLPSCWRRMLGARGSFPRGARSPRRRRRFGARGAFLFFVLGSAMTGLLPFLLFGLPEEEHRHPNLPRAPAPGAKRQPAAASGIKKQPAPDRRPRDSPPAGGPGGAAADAKRHPAAAPGIQKQLAPDRRPPDSPSARGPGGAASAAGKTVSRETRYYMVFSTSCSAFQDWQGLAFFHFAKMAGQPGNVTRLVSGCTPGQAAALRKLQDEKISPYLSDRFRLHVTPDYGVAGDQKYWNKPKGLKDWMEKELGYPGNAAHDDDVIIMVDPDMMLLRPITRDFSHLGVRWGSQMPYTTVSHGRPIAQEYAYGSSWLTSLKGNLSYVVGEDSPANRVSLNDAAKYYPAGPPYVLTGRDMYAMAVHWVKFLPRLHELFSGFMAEMHAYSVSAAHLELPHRLSTDFMVSDVNLGGNEGWAFLDFVSRKDSCNAQIPPERLPLVLHYCQRYSLGRWFFSKYKLREDIFECGAPLLREPPLNVGEIYDWNIFPNGVEKANYREPHRQKMIVYEGWILCKLIYTLNEVVTDFKKRHCGPDANFNKTWHFHEESNFEYALKNTTNPL